MGEEGGRIREEAFTKDGTVDLKGRPFVRSRGGRWKACSFIVGYEVFERMAFYGIVSNLVTYLTGKLHEGTVKSSNNVTNWAGTCWITPILGAYIADAHLGRYWTFVTASAIYLVGMCLLTLSVSLPSLRPRSCPSSAPSTECNSKATPFQIGIFYAALYIIAMGAGGTKPNISTMGADQFDDFEPKERKLKLSFFNWWMFSIFFGALFANTILIYIQDNVGWGLGYGLPTIGIAVSCIVFVGGTRFYRHRLVSGSPITRMVQVFVAAIRKRKVPFPADSEELYELDQQEYKRLNISRIESTPSLRFLDKAAVKSGPLTPWTLCPVTQVEETKQMVKMLPVLAITFMPSVMYAQIQTLFVKQGATLDRSMGPHFKVPPASLSAFITIFILLTLAIYDRIFVPIIKKYTKKPRGITLLQRLGIGLAMHFVTMIVAFFAERRRLRVIRAEGIFEAKAVVPLSIFVLLPQYALMGIAEGFVEVAKLEFFYDQAPERMKSLGTAYYCSSLGVGYFLSSFILSTVSNVTKRGGRKGWIQNNLNTSHIDYYYGLFVVLNAVNIIVFLCVAKYFVYNSDVDDTEMELRKEKEVHPRTVKDRESETVEY